MEQIIINEALKGCCLVYQVKKQKTNGEKQREN